MIKDLFRIKIVPLMHIQSQRQIQREAWGAHAPLFFCNHLFFCDRFEELHNVFIDVKLIINNAPLT